MCKSTHTHTYCSFMHILNHTLPYFYKFTHIHVWWFENEWNHAMITRFRTLNMSWLAINSPRIILSNNTCSYSSFTLLLRFAANWWRHLEAQIYYVLSVLMFDFFWFFLIVYLNKFSKCSKTKSLAYNKNCILKKACEIKKAHLYWLMTVFWTGSFQCFWVNLN